MLSTIWLLLFCGIISEHLASSQKSTKVKKNNLKVHINATGNTLVMKFLRPNENLKLEGFVLGYGSNFFSNQYIQWPENGKSYLTEVDAEPRYLIAVKPNENSKKSCKEKNSAMKPLQLVVGTLTPTSAFLSWGILINPQIDWSVLNKCPNDRFYTVRYREKNKDWLYQLCPTTEIVIDSLKPSTMYEFGVKDNTENGIWSKSYNHKTVQKSKENGQIQSTNTISKAVLRMAPEDTKALIPVTVIKQGFLNLTHFIQPKSTSEPTTTEKHKATQLPTTPKTTKKPDTEVYKPEIPYLQTSKPSPSTEAPQMEADSTQSVSKTITTEATHTFEQERVVATTEEQYVQELETVSKTETEPTTVFKESQTISAVEEARTTEVQTETIKISSSPSAPKETLATENPLPKFDPKETHQVSIKLISVHLIDDPLDTTEKSISPKPRATTESPSSTAAPKPTERVPINDIPTERVPTNDISPQLYGEPEVSLAPKTERPPLPKTTQRAETLQTKPVPNETQKISPYKPKKPQPTVQPRKAASTETPKDSIKPKIPQQTPAPTFAPYKPQHSSSRPRTSVGSKIRTVSSPPFPPVRPTMRKRPNATNVTGRPGNVLVPRAPSTARPNRTTVSIKAPMQLASSAPPEGTVEATVFSPTPKSELDALGKIRTTGPHIIYMGKKEFEPCSITESLKHFPTEEATNQEIVSRPLNPPSNLTIVTVEGCPSFVILDWEHPENETVTEYKVISTENGAPPGKDQSIITTNQTFSTVENLKANASYQFLVVPSNPLGEGPASNTVEFSTESADPRVSEPVTAGKDAIWTQIKFKSDSYSECKGKQFVKRTWYKKFVGIQLCNSLRYKIYLSDSLLGTFYNIGDQSGFGEDHCQFVDSFLDGRTGQQLLPEQLKTRKGFYRAVRQQPVEFGEIGGYSQIRYVHWYECGIAIPGKW